ncbi:hypothetical protein QOT17_020994 [Balamuthia mandrillaris]
MAQRGLNEPLLKQVSVDRSYGLDADRAIIDEQNRGMQGIAEDVEALRDVMADMKHLVDEGREHLNITEEQTSSAVANTAQANEELVVANKLACSARYKMLCIGVCCLLLLVILVVVLVVVLKKYL